MTALARILSHVRGAKAVGCGWIAPCLAHDDHDPSLAISEGEGGRVLLHCHGGCSVEAIVAALGLAMADLFEDARGQPRTRASLARPKPTQTVFSANDARRVWDLAIQRAWDDDAAERDRAVYEYLDGRGLGEAWELRLFGVLAAGMDLPDAVAYWPSTGHRVVAPLYDGCGERESARGHMGLPVRARAHGGGAV